MKPDLIGRFSKCKQSSWLADFSTRLRNLLSYFPLKFESAEIENGAFKIKIVAQALFLQ